jgi:hypothetical protein
MPKLNTTQAPFMLATEFINGDPRSFIRIEDAAHLAGQGLAGELMACMLFFMERPGVPDKVSQRAGRAMLAGFLQPLLPLVETSLVSLNAKERALLLERLMASIMAGAPAALALLDEESH